MDSHHHDAHRSDIFYLVGLLSDELCSSDQYLDTACAQQVDWSDEMSDHNLLLTYHWFATRCEPDIRGIDTELLGAKDSGMINQQAVHGMV